MPAFRQTSSTTVPSSACFKMNAICRSVNFDFFIARFSQLKIAKPDQEILIKSGPNYREQVRPGIVADLPDSHKEADWLANSVRNHVKACIHAALGTADQTFTPPFFNLGLDAVRCALKYVASIIIVFFCIPFAVSPSIIRVKMPMPFHRFLWL